MINALIIANGLNDYVYNKNDILEKYDIVIFLDGAVNNYSVKMIKDTKNYRIIGDFDSIDKDTLLTLPQQYIVKKLSQDITDLEFSLEYLLDNYSNINIDIVNWYHKIEIDHVMSNFITCIKYSNRMNIVIKNNNSCIYILNSIKRNNIEFRSDIGNIVSVISYSDIEGLVYSGLEYAVTSPTLPIFWNGVRNISTSNDVRIDIKSGIVAIFHELSQVDS